MRGRNHIRENETITVGPVRVLGVEVHELVEQNVGHGGHTHRGTGVTGVSLGGGINLIGEMSVDFRRMYAWKLRMRLKSLVEVQLNP